MSSTLVRGLFGNVTGHDRSEERQDVEGNPQKPATIEDLPDEVLLKIFKKLRQDDSDISALVSRKWERIISEGIGFNFEVGDSLELLGKIGFNRCVLSNGDVEDAPEFKYPLLVKVIWLTGPISETNFNKLILPLENLREFKTNLQAMSRLDLNQLPSLPFHELEEFTLYYPKYSTLTRQRYDNVNALLQKLDCPKLQKLHLVGMPLVPTQEGNMIQDICDLMARCGQKLKKLLFVLREGNMSRAHEDAERPSVPIPNNVAQLVNCTSIKKFYLECALSHQQPQDAILAFFNLLLGQQNSLEQLYVYTCTFAPLPVEVIARNAATLVSIEMNAIGIDGTLDCNAFANCSNLKLLTLLGRSMADGWLFEQNIIGPLHQQIANANALPVSLKSIRFANFLILNEDADFIALQLPNLHLLELENIGEDDTFGIRLETLNQIFLNKAIGSIRISRGVTESSLTQPTPAFAFTAALYSRLLQRERHRFTIYLDEDRYIFGHNSHAYFHENVTSFLDDEDKALSSEASYNFEDRRLSFNPAYNLEDFELEDEDWFDDDDDPPEVGFNFDREGRDDGADDDDDNDDFAIMADGGRGFDGSDDGDPEFLQEAADESQAGFQSEPSDMLADHFNFMALNETVEETIPRLDDPELNTVFQNENSQIPDTSSHEETSQSELPETKAPESSNRDSGYRDLTPSSPGPSAPQDGDPQSQNLENKSDNDKHDPDPPNPSDGAS